MKTIPTILTAIYMILVLLAVIPIFTAKDALSGIFAVALTAPWNSLLGRLLPANLAGNLASGLALVALGAAINAGIIYALARWVCGRVQT